jgi:hypothetical protein
MPFVAFNTVNDGLAAEARSRGHYIVHADPGDGGVWIPYGEGIWIQPLGFNVTSGGFTTLLKGLPGAMLGIHYHVGIVRGYTIQGHWGYLEHEWTAVPGTFVQEPAGEAHTLVVREDSPGPAIIYFDVQGGLIYLDKPEGGSFAGYDDGFSALEFARTYYRENGLDLAALDAMIR